MKKCVLVIFMSVLLLPLWAQHNGHSLSVDFGSYRQSLCVSHNHIQYTLAVIEGLNLRGTATGCARMVRGFSYKPLMNSHFLANITLEVRKTASFSGGLGLDVRLTLH